MKKEDLEFMINYRVEQLVSYLIEDRGLTILEAFDKVYNSKTYSLLDNPKSGFYFQSPGYVYSYLVEEMEMAQTMESEDTL